MPIYEYGCGDCGHQLEKLQKITDEPVTDCPECGLKGSMKKLVSRSSFVLKGGGWYKDHYGLKAAAGDSPSSSGGDSSSSSSGDSSSSSSGDSSSSSSGDSSSSSSGGDSSSSSSGGDSSSSGGSDD